MMRMLNAVLDFVKKGITWGELRILSSCIMLLAIVNGRDKVLMIKGVFDKITISESDTFEKEVFWEIIGCALLFFLIYIIQKKVTYIYTNLHEVYLLLYILKDILEIILSVTYFVGSLYFVAQNKEVPEQFEILFGIYIFIFGIVYSQNCVEKLKEKDRLNKKKKSEFFYSGSQRKIRCGDVVKYNNREYFVTCGNNKWGLIKTDSRMYSDKDILSLDVIMEKEPEKIRYLCDR